MPSAIFHGSNRLHNGLAGKIPRPVDPRLRGFVLVCYRRQLTTTSKGQEESELFVEEENLANVGTPFAAE